MTGPEQKPSGSPRLTSRGAARKAERLAREASALKANLARRKTQTASRMAAARAERDAGEKKGN